MYCLQDVNCSKYSYLLQLADSDSVIIIMIGTTMWNHTAASSLAGIGLHTHRVLPKNQRCGIVQVQIQAVWPFETDRWKFRPCCYYDQISQSTSKIWRCPKRLRKDSKRIWNTIRYNVVGKNKVGDLERVEAWRNRCVLALPHIHFKNVILSAASFHLHRMIWVWVGACKLSPWRYVNECQANSQCREKNRRNKKIWSRFGRQYFTHPLD